MTKTNKITTEQFKESAYYTALCKAIRQIADCSSYPETINLLKKSGITDDEIEELFLDVLEEFRPDDEDDYE